MSSSASVRHRSFSRNESSEGLSSPERQQLITNEQPEVDQTETSTNASAPMDFPTNLWAPIFDLEKTNRSGTSTVNQSYLGRLLATLKRFPKSFDITRGPGMLRCLLMLFILSVGIGVTVYACFMHFGALTPFSPGDNREGFADSPNMRGTFNIITACFSTILTCVYTSLHLDVPSPREGDVDEGEGDVEKDETRGLYDEERGEGTPHGQEPRWRRWVKKVAGWGKKLKAAEEVASWPSKLWIKIQSMKQRAVWVAFNIVAPELVAYVAVIEFLTARKWRKIMVEAFRRQYGIDLSKTWTITHQHMASMGGFKVQSIEGGCVILRSGNDFFKWVDDNPEAFKSINFKQVGIDIENCSKADGLLKACTVIQASWLVVQTIERVCKGLPVTELEVTTCAYVACATFTYACWWNKPYGVQNHIVLHVPPTLPDRDQDTNPTPFNRKALSLMGDTAGSLELRAYEGLCHPCHFNLASLMSFSAAVVLSGIVGAVAGAIHCTLWNAQFVNTNGQLLWRVCCITQIVAPILMSIFLAMPSLRTGGVLYREGKWDKKWDKRFLLSALIPCFFQFCARIVIFILIGYSFWSQPADVYRVADWSWSWFPHIS